MGTQRRGRAVDLDVLKHFRYKPLSQPHFLRILKVRPARIAQETIDCELLEVEALKDGRIYDALSYCWGTDPEEQSIRIHTEDEVYAFPVKEHLYEALLALRFEDKARYVWVDAICMNQRDGKEKSQQVPRMTEIFTEGRYRLCLAWQI